MGGRAGSTALRDWASKELQGCGPDDELPAYRVVPAMLKVDAALPSGWIRGQPFSPLMLPNVVKEVLGTDEQIPLRQGIAEIEKLPAKLPALAADGGTIDRLAGRRRPPPGALPGVQRNDLWSLRVAAVNLRRLLTLGLARQGQTWALA